jgi:hypothetical protein
MDVSGSPLSSQSFCLRFFGLLREAVCKKSRNQEMQNDSQRRTPPRFEIRICFPSERRKPSTGYIRLKLPVPLIINEPLKPLSKAFQLFRRQALNGIFKFNRTHGDVKAEITPDSNIQLLTATRSAAAMGINRIALSKKPTTPPPRP